ncbi:MAG TPA: biopolymer transporter ExbD [Stellaceae bacterium]|jgi:biopolymer transport protein ExbD|nr:biopolymer transporter ExbD [Stellaceae bacterium]
MAINLNQGGEGEPLVDINTTPLIDVMLVLLIMLIITIPVQTHAVKLDMPQANPPPPIVQPTVVDLAIDFDGTITWNGTNIPDRATLENYLQSAAVQDPQPEIHLNPNKLVKYSYVAMVLAEAQRLGVVKIGLVGNEQFME